MSDAVPGKLGKMATLQCRVQYLDDTDPFNSTNFPEPTRPPTYTFLTNVPLANQIAGVNRILNSPHKVSESLMLFAPTKFSAIHDGGVQCNLLISSQWTAQNFSMAKGFVIVTWQN